MAAAVPYAQVALMAYGMHQTDVAFGEQRKANKKALAEQKIATANALKSQEEQLELQKQAIAAANRKKPDTTVMVNKRKALARRSKTMLTGGGLGLPGSQSTLTGG